MKKKEFQNLPSTETPITAENLNEMQSNIEESCVIVSPTEPTTNEKVWIQKGKNLFKDSLIKSVSSNAKYENGTFIQTQADTNPNPNWKLQAYKEWDYVTSLQSFSPQLGRNGYSFVKKSNFDNIQIGVNGSVIDTVMHIDVSHLINEETYTISFNALNITQGNFSWNEIQIEPGSVAREYKPYIEPKIYIKNNGVFEEFIDTEIATDGNEIAIKHPDGTLEVYGQAYFKANFEQWGNLYAYDYTTPVKFPIPFKEKPRICGVNTSGHACIVTRIEASETHITMISIARPNMSDGGFLIDFIAKGRWK